MTDYQFKHKPFFPESSPKSNAPMAGAAQNVSDPNKNVGNLLFTNKFKSRVVDISKLICEIWLKKERGKKFEGYLKERECTVKEALTKVGIDFNNVEFLEFALDTSTYNGSIEMVEDLHSGLKFLWKLPYAPWPEHGIDKGDIENWIYEVDKWLDKIDDKGNTTQSFPVPDNIYIPLATM